MAFAKIFGRFDSLGAELQSKRFQRQRKAALDLFDPEGRFKPKKRDQFGPGNNIPDILRQRSQPQLGGQPTPGPQQLPQPTPSPAFQPQPFGPGNTVPDILAQRSQPPNPLQDIINGVNQRVAGGGGGGGGFGPGIPIRQEPQIGAAPPPVGTGTVLAPRRTLAETPGAVRPGAELISPDLVRTQGSGGQFDDQTLAPLRAAERLERGLVEKAGAGALGAEFARTATLPLQPARIVGEKLDIPGLRDIPSGEEAAVVGREIGPEVFRPSNLIPIPVLDPLVARSASLVLGTTGRLARPAATTLLRNARTAIAAATDPQAIAKLTKFADDLGQRLGSEAGFARIPGGEHIDDVSKVTPGDISTGARVPEGAGRPLPERNLPEQQLPPPGQLSARELGELDAVKAGRKPIQLPDSDLDTPEGATWLREARSRGLNVDADSVFDNPFAYKNEVDRRAFIDAFNAPPGLERETRISRLLGFEEAGGGAFRAAPTTGAQGVPGPARPEPSPSRVADVARTLDGVEVKTTLSGADAEKAAFLTPEGEYIVNINPRVSHTGLAERLGKPTKELMEDGLVRVSLPGRVSQSIVIEGRPDTTKVAVGRLREFFGGEQGLVVDTGPGRLFRGTIDEFTPARAIQDTPEIGLRREPREPSVRQRVSALDRAEAAGAAQPPPAGAADDIGRQAVPPKDPIEAQKAIGDFEDELIAKYGDDEVFGAPSGGKTVNNITKKPSKLAPEELSRLNSLYDAKSSARAGGDPETRIRDIADEAADFGPGSSPPELRGTRLPDPPNGQTGRQLKDLSEYTDDFEASTKNFLGAITRIAGQAPPLKSALSTVNRTPFLREELGYTLGGYLRKKQSIDAWLAAREFDMAERESRLFSFKNNIERNIGATPEDIVLSPDLYDLNPKQRSFVDDLNTLLADQLAFEKSRGVKVTEIVGDKAPRGYFPRTVVGVGGTAVKRGPVRAGGGKQGFQKNRYFDTMQDGLDNGYDYANGFTPNVMNRIRAGQVAALDKEAEPVIGQFRTRDTSLRPSPEGELVESVIGRGGEPNAALKVLETINNISRPITTGADAGFMGLQWIPAAARNWVAAGRGTMLLLDAWVTDSRLYAQYIRRELDNGNLVQFLNDGGIWNQSEFSFEFAAKTKGLSFLNKGPFARFNSGFVNPLNMLALENYKGMVGVNDFLDRTFGAHRASQMITRAFAGFGKIEGKNAGQQAASVASKLTLRLAPAQLGIRSGQSALETAFAWAPRYYRAAFGLLGDALQGGMRGAEARRALTQMVGGVLITYYAVQQITGKEPDWEKMTFTDKGQKFGMGGPFMSMVQLVRKIADNPESLKERDIGRNPVFRWVRGKASPAVSLVADIVQGETFLGEKLDEPIDYLEVLADRVTPFPAQAARQVKEAGGSTGQAVKAGAVEFFAGARTFPVSPFSTYKEAYEAEFGQELGPGSNKIVDTQGSPELKALKEKVDERSLEFGSGFAESQQKREAVQTEDEGPLIELSESLLQASVQEQQQIGPNWVRGYSDILQNRAAVGAAEFYGQEPNDDPKFASYNAYNELSPDAEEFAVFSDENELLTGQIDWDAYWARKDKLFEDLDPLLQTAIEQQLKAIAPEIQEVETRFKEAKAVLADPDKPQRYRNLPPEAYNEVRDFVRKVGFWRKARKENQHTDPGPADGAGFDNPAGNDSDLNKTLALLASHWLSRYPQFDTAQKLYDWGRVLGSSKKRDQMRNPEYDPWLQENRALLFPFYPNLYSFRVLSPEFAPDQPFPGGTFVPGQQATPALPTAQPAFPAGQTGAGGQGQLQ